MMHGQTIKEGDVQKMALFNQKQLGCRSMKWENKQNLWESEIVPTGVPLSLIRLQIP